MSKQAQQIHTQKVSIESSYEDEHRVWKGFSQHEISHSVAHYLMAIDEACEGSDEGCKAAQVARILGVSRNAVSLQLKSLQHSNLITLSRFKLIKLTDKGKLVVNNIVSARRSVKRFLVSFLEVPENFAEQDSCKIEHLISPETRIGLTKLMQFIAAKPEISQPFMESLREYQVHCEVDEQQQCPICQNSCSLEANS